MQPVPEMLPTPRGLTVRRGEADSVEIVLRWRYGVFNVVVFVGWLACFVACLIVPFLDDSASGLGEPLVRAGVLAAIVLVLGYAPIAMVANQTTFALRGPDLRIQHSPLWWPGSKRVSLGGQRRFMVRGLQGPLARSNSSQRLLMGLNAQHRWVTLWRFNSRIVPSPQMHALCRILEWHAHHVGA